MILGKYGGKLELSSLFSIESFKAKNMINIKLNKIIKGFQLIIMDSLMPFQNIKTYFSYLLDLNNKRTSNKFEKKFPKIIRYTEIKKTCNVTNKHQNEIKPEMFFNVQPKVFT
ncbi:hypothetical protein HYG87_08330 [Methanobacterium alkalithermotolerans]|uniref:Uncharacterized protein n=1 Tax=Methanobacterium alkalithermotolerans TaxID=2731220 RepID=A0A8T8K5F3_9EURY|nr:hypothetical protein [Methanobacterium alkalithermotolerans]QUH23764.1 hypothetical protein HYG87_08330 [Methanobacterium alkalithermotolerans]